MSGAQELAVREKQELANKEEKTIPGRYTPLTRESENPRAK
jgi:hypothetical protein